MAPSSARRVGTRRTTVHDHDRHHIAVGGVLNGQANAAGLPSPEILSRAARRVGIDGGVTSVIEGVRGHPAIDGPSQVVLGGTAIEGHGRGTAALAITDGRPADLGLKRGEGKDEKRKQPNEP